MLNGFYHYYGRLIHSDGECYEGEFQFDKAEGYGTYSHADGTNYQGYWENDMQHGLGKEVLAGGVYEGEF